jgi:hypothetical protein
VANLCDSYLTIEGAESLRSQCLSEVTASAPGEHAEVEAAAEVTVLAFTTPHEPPRDYVIALSKRYPDLAFELAYVLEFNEGGGFMRCLVGETVTDETTDGEEATYALLDHVCPALSESQRSAHGQ